MTFGATGEFGASALRAFAQRLGRAVFIPDPDGACSNAR
jgi:hypothetical protein